MNTVQDHKEGLVISVFVQPRSSGNRVAGLHGGAIKIKLTSPPVEGEANKQCIRFLAKTLKLPGSALEIISGHTGRSKRILIRTDSAEELAAVKKSLASILSSTESA